MKSVQAAKAKIDSGRTSPRSSVDSGPSRAKVGSPGPRTQNGGLVKGDQANGQSLAAADYVYLKNVLLQFLEQKDKKHQMQLIPVLGMLLHFDRYVGIMRLLGSRN